MSGLKILSLLPAATEIVYLLGLEKYLVGVSHECDYPKEAKLLPKVTSSPISNHLSSKEINEQVAKLKHKGSGVFHIDQKLLEELKPNLILTQELCDVCAISWTQVKKAAKVLTTPVIPSEQSERRNLDIVSLEPESIDDILENIRTIGKFTGKEKKAEKVISSLKNRLKTVQSRLPRFARNDAERVLVIEWLEPLMVAGHWVPEMVEKAGGVSVKIKSGQKSYPVTIEEVATAEPDIVVFAPCGFDIKRTQQERKLIEKLLHIIVDRQKSVETPKVFLMDGNAYLTRPGPRIIDGIEILAEILHPQIFPKKHQNSDWQELNYKS